MTMLPSLPTSLNMNRLGKTIEWLKGFKEYEEIMGGGWGSSDQMSYDDCTPFFLPYPCHTIFLFNFCTRE